MHARGLHVAVLTQIGDIEEAHRVAEEMVAVSLEPSTRVQPDLDEAHEMGGISYRAAVRAADRDPIGALRDYERALRVLPTSALFEVGIWTELGAIACLHLLERHDDAASRAVLLRERCATWGSEWQHHVDYVYWIAQATVSDPVSIRSGCVAEMHDRRGQVTPSIVQTRLGLLGILADLCGEHERATLLLSRSVGPLVLHLCPLHAEHVARLCDWPDDEFHQRRRQLAIDATAEGALPGAAALLEEELDRILAAAPG